MLGELRRKDCAQEEGDDRLSPSSTIDVLKLGGLQVVSKLLLTSVVLCYNNFLDVGGGFLFSDVINSGLETVIPPILDAQEPDACSELSCRTSFHRSF